MINNDIYFIDLDTKTAKEEISEKIKKEGISKELLKKGKELVEAQNALLEMEYLIPKGIDVDSPLAAEETRIASDAYRWAKIRAQKIFYKMCDLIDFDCENLISLTRQMEQMQLRDETAEAGGFAICFDNDISGWKAHYYFIPDNFDYSVFMIASDDKRIREIDAAPDWILEDDRVQKTLEQMQNKNN